MNKIISTLFFFLLITTLAIGQEYLEEFDDLVDDQTTLAAGYAGSVTDGEWTITGDGTSGQYSIFGYKPVDGDGNLTSLDITGNNKIFVRAKASSNGTQLRLDVKDSDGYATTIPGITKFLIADYTVFEFDFTGVYQDGGYSGTSCDSADAPCSVDGTKISAFEFYINPGIGSFSGSVVIDFLAVGTEPQVGPMSDVFQDHFDDTTSLRFISSSTEGYTNTIEDSQWKIKGDGTNGMWDPVSMITFNPANLDTVDISVKDGEDKIYIRMRSSQPGTSIRLDLQDINLFATTAGSITQVISDEFETYEFNYSGSYQDLAYGGTGCEVGPCDVDSDRIANMILFINPGVEAFAGQVDIEYISVGTALESTGEADVLAYGDHFSGDDETYVTTGGTYDLTVEGSLLSIVGSGEDVPFSNIGYTPNDENGPVIVNGTANNKVFIKARSTTPNTLLRIDLIDTSNYATTTPSFTRLLEEEFSILELNFSNQYFDAGYGGSACEEGTGPCPVDGSAIQTMLLYPNPADGGFNGTIEIDYISFGAPMGDDVADVFKYTDQFDDDDASKFGGTDGIVVAEADGELTITGDGTSGEYAAFSYIPHNQETDEEYLLDITSNNKVYVKAKSTIAGVNLRMDVRDAAGIATTEPSRSIVISEEYQILEFDFTDTYMDGGYGGTECTENAPCLVDGTMIEQFVFYVNAGTGAFDGQITLDWFSTIDPIEVDTVDLGPAGVNEYQDDFEDDDLAFLSENTGQTLSAADGIVIVTGDGSSGQYDPIGYITHDDLDTIIVNAVNNNNKIFIRVKTSLDSIPLRLDLVDNLNFHTSLAGLTQIVKSEFEIIEYDFTGNYKDGGYGDTGCDVGPCNVDGERIASLQLYIDPGVGAFNGDLHLDWISFGEPISVNVVETKITKAAKIYPNPAEGEFYLELDSKISGQMRANLIDITGKVVSTQSLGNTSVGKNYQTINITDMNTGIYFLQVIVDNKEAFYQKIMIK